MISDKECISCGLCCKFTNRESVKQRWNIDTDSSGWCVHYSKESGCDIYYDNRPIPCILFPREDPTCIKLRKENNIDK